MTIQDAITSAIEGGYVSSNKWGSSPHHVPHATLLLDPKFWQALGKTMGWDEHGTCYHYPEGAYRHRYNETEHDSMEHWRYNWHRMVDALAEGKSIEQYFETL